MPFDEPLIEVPNLEFRWHPRMVTNLAGSVAVPNDTTERPPRLIDLRWLTGAAFAPIVSLRVGLVVSAHTNQCAGILWSSVTNHREIIELGEFDARWAVRIIYRADFT